MDEPKEPEGGERGTGEESREIQQEQSMNANVIMKPNTLYTGFKNTAKTNWVYRK